MGTATVIRSLLLASVLATVAGAWEQSGSSALSLTVNVESAIRLGNSGVTLVRTSADALGGDTSLIYKMRTRTLGGSGNITVKITSDFPAGNTSLADSLTFTCMASGPGTGCVGAQTASKIRDTTVVRFNAGAHSSFGGDSGHVNWKLTNEPNCPDDVCIAIATFTISSN